MKSSAFRPTSASIKLDSLKITPSQKIRIVPKTHRYKTHRQKLDSMKITYRKKMRR